MKYSLTPHGKHCKKSCPLLRVTEASNLVTQIKMESNTNITTPPLHKHMALYLKLIHVYLEGYSLFSKISFLISASKIQFQVHFDFKTLQLNHLYHPRETKGWRELRTDCSVHSEYFSPGRLNFLCLRVDAATEHKAGLLKRGPSSALWQWLRKATEDNRICVTDDPLANLKLTLWGDDL